MVKKWGRKLLSLFLALVLALAMSVTAFAFSDTRGHWAEETIQAMTEKGYLSGYPDGTFGPNNTIRRAEFMRILTSMYGLTERSDAYILWTDVALTHGTPPVWEPACCCRCIRGTISIRRSP